VPRIVPRRQRGAPAERRLRPLECQAAHHRHRAKTQERRVCAGISRDCCRATAAGSRMGGLPGPDHDKRRAVRSGRRKASKVDSAMAVSCPLRLSFGCAAPGLRKSLRHRPAPRR